MLVAGRVVCGGFNEETEEGPKSAKGSISAKISLVTGLRAIFQLVSVEKTTGAPREREQFLLLDVAQRQI